MLTDVKLVTKLQAGEDTSFEILFQRHYQRVYNILYRLLGNQADAEDMAQQVFLKLYRAPQRLEVEDDEANVAGWLYRVAINTGYNHLRGKKRRRFWLEKVEQFLPFEISFADPAQVAESHDTQQQVRDVLGQLKPREAKLLLLRHSGLSYKELAMVLNVASGSIGSLLTRAERAFAHKYRLTFPEKE